MIQSLTRYAWLSIAAAVATIALKGAAWALTDSVGLLSDALESVVNLVAAVVTLGMLRLAAQPPDEGYAYGHTKAEYFSSGVEGASILLAAGGIAWAAISRLGSPQPLKSAGLGVAITAAASVINLVVARVLLSAGAKHRSIALEADGHHLMTDVWTSAGVIAGIGLVAATGWQRLDPIVALLVAANIVRSGVTLVVRSTQGLLDAAWPEPELTGLRRILEKHAIAPIQFHALRTRQAGARRFVSVHVLVPGAWSVAQGHELLERIEAEVRAAFPHTTVDTHLEPVEDPASFEDLGLDR